MPKTKLKKNKKCPCPVTHCTAGYNRTQQLGRHLSVVHGFHNKEDRDRIIAGELVVHGSQRTEAGIASERAKGSQFRLDVALRATKLAKAAIVAEEDTRVLRTLHRAGLTCVEQLRHDLRELEALLDLSKLTRDELLGLLKAVRP